MGMDNLFSTNTDGLDWLVRHGGSRFRLLIGDVLNPRDVAGAFQSAGAGCTVYNLAAQSSADPAAADPELTELVNLRGPRIVLDAAAEHGARAVVFGSSMRLYGPALPAHVNGATPLGVITDLSHLSKVYAEQLHAMYAHTRGLACGAVRLGLTFGVAPVMKRDYRFMTAPNKFCLQAARGEPLTVRPGGTLGLIHVSDAARALEAAARACSSGSSPVWNAVGDCLPIDAVARHVAAAAGERGLTAQLCVDGLSDEGEAVAGAWSGSRALDFRPQVDIRAGIEETLDHFQTTPTHR